MSASIRITLAVIATLLFIAATNLSSKYYQTDGDVVQAILDESDPTAKIYRLTVLCKADTDTAVFYIPMPNGTERVGIEWSAVSTNDSVYVEIKYGSVFEVQQADAAIYYATLQDTLLYWYKSARQYSVTGPEDLLSSRYFVVKVKGSSKLPAGGAYITLKVTIPKK